MSRRMVILFMVLAGALPMGCNAANDCTNPAPGIDRGDVDPLMAGQPLAGFEVEGKNAVEVAGAAADAGLAVTYRFTYGVGADPNEGFSECWCVPPPHGHVTLAGYDSAGRLIVMVDSGERLSEVRPQPAGGWGC